MEKYGTVEEMILFEALWLFVTGKLEVKIIHDVLVEKEQGSNSVDQLQFSTSTH